MTIAEFSYPIFSFIALKTLNYLTFQSFDFECTWWRLFQKHVVRIKFDIYVLLDARSRLKSHLVHIKAILLMGKGTLTYFSNLYKRTINRLKTNINIHL